MKDKPETTSFWWGKLPHWEVAGGRYFVTVHLKGAIPASGMKRIHDFSVMLDSKSPHNPRSVLNIQRIVFMQMEHWLDTAPKKSDLIIPEIAEEIVNALDYRHEKGIWDVFSYVIMPNHIHVLLKVQRGTLRSTMISFKNWTARRAVAILGRECSGFWQREWFDHWSRSMDEDNSIIRYIHNNPTKAQLVQNCEDWQWLK